MMKFGQKTTIQSRMAVAEAKRNGRPVKTKDIAPVEGPSFKASGTNPFKKKIGVKAVWKF